MSSKERRINPRSLENLKLGPAACDRNKQRTNLTLLPETVQWLKGRGNASALVDDLVAAAKNGKLKPSDSSDEVLTLRQEISELRSQLERWKQMDEIGHAEHVQVLKDSLAAAKILNEALKLKPNAGGAIKEKIRQALALVDDL